MQTGQQQYAWDAWPPNRQHLGYLYFINEMDIQVNAMRQANIYLCCLRSPIKYLPGSYEQVRCYKFLPCQTIRP